MNLLAFNTGTNLEVRNSGPAGAHIATIEDVEKWAAKRDLMLVSRTEWLKLTEE